MDQRVSQIVGQVGKSRKQALVLLVLAFVNSSITAVLIIDSSRKAERITSLSKETRQMEKTLFTPSSLDNAILLLKRERDTEMLRGKTQTGGSPLKITGEVLALVRKNKLRVSSYRIERKGDKDELVLAADGKIKNVMRLLYDLYILQEGLEINYCTIDTGAPKKPVKFVLRVTHA